MCMCVCNKTMRFSLFAFSIFCDLTIPFNKKGSWERSCLNCLVSQDLHSGSSDPQPPPYSTLMIGLFWQDHLEPLLVVAKPGFPSKEFQVGAALCHFRIDLSPLDLHSLNHTTKSLLLLWGQNSLLSAGNYCMGGGASLKANFHVWPKPKQFFLKCDSSSLCLVRWSLVYMWENVSYPGT